eukprot:403351926
MESAIQSQVSDKEIPQDDPGNVFNKIISDVSKEDFDRVVRQFRILENQFSELLDTFSEDFYKPPTSNANSQSLSTLLNTDNQYFKPTYDEQTVLSQDNVYKYCSNCFKTSSTLKQCSQCKFTHYCQQSCQKDHWATHRSECKSPKSAISLKSMPQSLRLLLSLLYLKTDSKNPKFMSNLQIFNEQVITMISNASKILMKSQEKREEVMNYAMVCFLKTAQSSNFEVNIDNFKLIVHLYFLSICNGFGIADNQMLRIGTGLYYPSNLLNHSCDPNCMVLFRGQTQFIVTCRPIEADEEITICYIDNGISERIIRQQYLQEQYHFNCMCARCLKQIGEGTELKEQKVQIQFSEEQQILNKQALHEESLGNFDKSLSQLSQLYKSVETNKSTQIFQNSMIKELLERLVYLSVMNKDYKFAVKFQQKLVDLCEIMYIKEVKREDELPHPLIALHYYQLGKLLSQRKKYQEAIDNLQKAMTLVSAYYGLKSSKDGKMIDEKLVHEVNENYLANCQKLQSSKN